jgi:hypothetical protein
LKTIIKILYQVDQIAGSTGKRDANTVLKTGLGSLGLGLDGNAINTE